MSLIVGILKNAPEPQVPEEFFDLGNRTAVKEINGNEDTVMEDGEDADEDSEPSPDTTKTVASGQEDVLPEGFFDDPLLDAKVRNVVTRSCKYLEKHWTSLPYVYSHYFLHYGHNIPIKEIR
jgi:hypothetical protein